MTGNRNRPPAGLKVPDLGSNAEPCAGHPSGGGHPQPSSVLLPVGPATAGTAAYQPHHARRPVHRSQRPARERELLGGVAAPAQEPPAAGAALEIKRVLR